MITSQSTNRPDVLLVGAGIMSATLAVLLKELDPSLNIEFYEVLGSAAQESSNAWNNAGTGHAALCELNYTPEKSDGSIDISKALGQHRVRSFPSVLSLFGEKGSDQRPGPLFIRTPYEFCARTGEYRVLKKRFEALSTHPCYHRDGIIQMTSRLRSGSAGDGRPRSKRGSCGDAHGDRY